MEWPVKNLGNRWGWTVILYDLQPMEIFKCPDYPQYYLYEISILDNFVWRQLFDFVAKKDP